MAQAGWVSWSESFRFLSSISSGLSESSIDLGGSGSISRVDDDMGRIWSWSSTTKHWLHVASERMNRSLNLATTSWWLSVLYRLCTS